VAIGHNTLRGVVRQASSDFGWHLNRSVARNTPEQALGKKTIENLLTREPTRILREHQNDEGGGEAAGLEEKERAKRGSTEKGDHHIRGLRNLMIATSNMAASS